MNTYERQVVVNDKEGLKFVCTMEGERNNDKFDNNRSIPSLLEQLSEHERAAVV